MSHIIHETHSHVHSKNCGRTRIKHGEHFDWLIDGRLPHRHDEHCDDHGAVLVM